MEWKILSQNNFEPLELDDFRFCFQNSMFFMLLSKFQAVTRSGRVMYKSQGVQCFPGSVGTLSTWEADTGIIRCNWLWLLCEDRQIIAILVTRVPVPVVGLWGLTSWLWGYFISTSQAWPLWSNKVSDVSDDRLFPSRQTTVLAARSPSTNGKATWMDFCIFHISMIFFFFKCYCSNIVQCWNGHKP